MQGYRCRRRAGPAFAFVFGPALGLAVLLGACSHGMHTSSEPPTPSPEDAQINIPPANYKADILGAMRAYLNDPTGIRDAGISEPAIKGVGNHPRYVVCVRYNAKKRGNEYAGPRELAAVFMVGKFDRFLEAERPRERPQEQKPQEETATEQKPQGPCAGAVYAPFPELQKLTR